MSYLDRHYAAQAGPLKCAECQAELVATSRAYKCCPNGHGLLFPNGGSVRQDVAALLRAYSLAKIREYDKWRCRLSI